MARVIFVGPRNVEGGALSFRGAIAELGEATVEMTSRELRARKAKRRFSWQESKGAAAAKDQEGVASQMRAPTFIKVGGMCKDVFALFSRTRDGGGA